LALLLPVEPEVNSQMATSSRRVLRGGRRPARMRSLPCASASRSNTGPSSRTEGGTSASLSTSPPVCTSGTRIRVQGSASRKVSAMASATRGMVITAAARVYSTR
jgi:hypothetical protein